MAIRGHAPKVFGRLSTRGVPHIALLTMTAASLVFFGISFAPGGAGQIWTYVTISSRLSRKTELTRLPYTAGRKLWSE